MKECFRKIIYKWLFHQSEKVKTTSVHMGLYTQFDLEIQNSLHYLA